MLPLLALLCPAIASPTLGLEYVPLSRGDLTWVDEGRTSGTGVGEFDGLLQPSLRFHGGVLRNRGALLAGLAVARITTTTWLADQYTRTHVGVVRVGLDYRRYLRPSSHPGVVPWLGLGAYGDIPSARNESSSYTPEEQEAADEGARAISRSLGGVGGRLGPGFSWNVTEDVSVGGAWNGVLHWGQVLDEDTLSVSVLVFSEASLLFEVRL